MTMSRIFALITMFVIIQIVVSQLGRKFLLAFPPRAFEDAATDICRIVINTESRAEISLTFNDITISRIVDEESHTIDIDGSMRAPLGHSNKALIIESNIDISVQVQVKDFYGDAYLALPIKNDNAEYFIAMPSGTYPDDEDDIELSSVITIASEKDNTRVELYAPASGDYTLVDTIYLHRFDTYTYGFGEEDLTGWKISSNGSISVVSGASVFGAHADGCNIPMRFNGGYVFSPSIDQAGYRFIVPKIDSPTNGVNGIHVRIISFSEGNIVTLPDQSVNEILHTGQFLEHYVKNWNEITRIDCLQPCSVFMFIEQHCGFIAGQFLMNITPLELAKNYARFSTFESFEIYEPHSNFITIISETQNVMLDDTLLTGWRGISGWQYYYDLSIEVQHGIHKLQSLDEGKFVAFVYGHTGSCLNECYGYGYGSQLVHEDVAFSV